MSNGAARPCPACGHTSSRVQGEVDGFPMRSCVACRTLFTERLPGDAEAKDYENWDYYEGGLDVPDFVLGRLREIVAPFDRYRRLNTWLDVGCGAGTLLRAAEDRGWKAVGTEVAPGVARAVADLDVRLGYLGALDLPHDGFDVVSLIEVIEHVADPAGLIAQAAPLIRPGGALYLTTPHVRGLAGRMLGVRWAVVAPPEHLQLFSAAGLRTLLKRTGLTVRSVRTHSVNPYELAAALRRGRERAPAGGNTEMSYRLNESLSTRRGGAALKSAVNAALAATRLGDTIKLVAERP